MLRIIQRFYEFRPLTRIILASLTVLLLSALIVGAGLYQYLSVLKAENLDGGRAISGEIFVSKGLCKPSLAIQNFLDAAMVLNTSAKTLAAQKAERTESLKAPRPGASAPLPLSPMMEPAFPGEMREAVLGAIASMSRLEWDEVLNFGFKGSLQGDVFNFTMLRERARFLASFTLQMKKENPQFDSGPLFQAMSRDAILMERVSPTLIGKMICLAIGGIMTRTMHEMALAEQISSAEAVTLLEVVSRFERLQLTIAEAMQMEYQFISKSYFHLYSKAPLGSWLLEIAFGDFLEQYQHLLSALETMDKETLMKEINSSRHPLIWISFPNFVRAREIYREKLTWLAIVRQELFVRSGSVSRIPDPYGTEPLRSVERDGKRLFYAVGPNGKDDAMTGDDVFIK